MTDEIVDADETSGVTAEKRREVVPRLFNMGLRLGSLGTKLVLMLFMGRFLGLEEMGTYGLVTAYVALLIPLLGLRLDYVASRDIVDTDALDLARKMRDQMVFYGITYALLVLAVGLAMLFSMKGLNAGTAVFTLVISILESIATITSSNLVSLKRPVLANFLFFIRSSLWVLPVIVLGYLYPSLRTADVIFALWLAGVALSLFVTAYVWRALPWAAVMRAPVDWGWIIGGVRKSLPIWLGAVGVAASANVDRFVVEYYLGRQFVGITTFYASFVVAMSALLQSGIFAFGYPHLISAHRRGDTDDFRRVSSKMMLQAILSCGFMALVIGGAVPVVGQLFRRPEFYIYASTLWLMLLGAFMRLSTESLYWVMYARHQDRAIWIGNLLAFAPALGFNMLLIPWAGLIGVGYSAVITAIFLCLWRIYHVEKFNLRLQKNKEIASV